MLPSRCCSSCLCCRTSSFGLSEVFHFQFPSIELCYLSWSWSFQSLESPVVVHRTVCIGLSIQVDYQLPEEKQDLFWNHCLEQVRDNWFVCFQNITRFHHFHLHIHDEMISHYWNFFPPRCCCVRHEIILFPGCFISSTKFIFMSAELHPNSSVWRKSTLRNPFSTSLMWIPIDSFASEESGRIKNIENEKRNYYFITLP